MANIRAIRNRIKSIESTRQITKTMRMVAAAKLSKTQRAFSRLDEFATVSRDILCRLAADGCDPAAPLLCPHQEDNSVCYVLMVGNRGLCGVYNSALLKFLQELAADEPADKSLVVCGRWGREQLATLGLPVLKCFDGFGDTPTAEEAGELSAYLEQLYQSGRADRVVLVYQHFRSVLRQEPQAVPLLPLRAEEESEGFIDVIFEPDRASLLEPLTELVLQNTVFTALLEARTGEHAARMTAMTAASDNTDELIRELTLQLNYARQATITTEISEIVGGASAQENTEE